MQDGGGMASTTESGMPLNLNDIALGFIDKLAQGAADKIVGQKTTSSTNTQPQPDWAAMSTSALNARPLGVSMPVFAAGVAVVALLGVFIMVKK